MSSGDSQEEDLQKSYVRADRAGNSKNKGNLDDLHDGYFEESTSSEDDEIDFKAEPLDFSSSESDDDKNSDIELKTSDEEQLLNLYDKKLRDKMSTKKSSKGEGDGQEIMTSRIAEFMKKMKSETKDRSRDKKSFVEDTTKPRKSKASSKKLVSKEQTKPTKTQPVKTKYDTSDSGSETGSDSDFDALADTMANMTPVSSVKKPAKIRLDKGKGGKEVIGKDVDIRKKIAEMKKIVGGPKTPDHIDEQLLKAKQRVTDWMREEDAKSAALKERFSASRKFPVDTLMKEISGRKPVKTPKAGNTAKLFDARNPLPPVKTKKPLGGPIKNIMKKEDVLQILRDVDSSIPAKSKAQRVGLEKSTDALRKNMVPTKLTSGLPARLLPSKSDSNKISAKMEPTQYSMRNTPKLADKKSSLKKSSVKLGE